MTTTDLRPLSVSELLDRTFFLYRRHFLLFIGIAAVSSLLTLVFGLILAVARTDRSLLLWPLAALAALLVSVTVHVFTQAATVVAVSDIQLGRPVGVVDVFARIRSRIGELILLSLNVGFRIAIGILLLVVPGILVALMYSLTTPVAVLEDRTISESLPRSAELTKGHRGRIFVIYLLFFVLTLIVSWLWQIPAAMLIAGFGRGRPTFTTDVVSQVGAFLTSVLIGSIPTIALTLVYYDVRVRKEAFDLQHMMQQLDALTPDRPATA